MQKIVHTNIQRWKTLMKQKSRGDEKHFLSDIFLELASKHVFIIISNVVSLFAKVGSTRDDFLRLLWCWLQHAAFQRANSYFWLVDSENCCVCCDVRRNTHRYSCDPCGCPLTLFPSLLFWFTGWICWWIWLRVPAGAWITISPNLGLSILKDKNPAMLWINLTMIQILSPYRRHYQ